MPVEVGVGYVSVVPETRGFGPALTRQINGPAGDAGQAAGRTSGDGFLGGIGGVVKGGIAAVAVGAGALFAAGFSEAVAQDKSNAKLGAQLGLTEKESARLGKVAGSVFGKGYGESIDQVNDSLRGLAQNGVAAVNAPKKDLAALSKSALNLAEAFDVEVGESAKAAGQMIKTGLAKNGKQAFDLITAGFQSGADKGGDFIDTLNEYGTQFRKAGLDGATSIGLISQALQAGARDGDVAADAIKEFSIRAVDGSETTSDGFKALGLSADDMANKFAKGGKSANGVLDLTLDRLRGIKDPVKQSAAAVALFGTQSEDLGAALYSMDPSTAAAGLGKVGGAAARMGKTLHNTATNDIEVFKRQALQGLANVADKYALPAVAAFGSFLLTRVLPPIKTVGGAALDVLVPALKGTGDAFQAGGRWVREYGAWLIPLGVALGGLALTMGASAIATGATTAVFAVYRGVILGAAAVTRGYAVVQGVLNAVMSANPVGLIITGVAALAALLVVAYQKSDTFRGIVQATWSGIKTGWDAAYTNAIKPGLDGFMTGLRAVGAGASWLWGTVLSPVFSGIALAAKVMFAVVATLVIAPLVIAFRAFGAIGTWLYRSAIKPSFDGIAWAGGWLWNTILSPIFVAMVAGVRGAGAVAVWLYQNAFRPAFSGIGTAGSFLWSGVLRPTFGLITSGVRGVGAVGTWLYRSSIKPAFDGIRAAGSTLWNSGLKPLFDKGKAGVRLFGAAFGTAKDAIGKAMGQVKNVTRTPVNFIIEWVYSKGIKATWDKVAGFVGLGKLPAAPKLLAKGGTVGDGWGPAAPMKVNRPTAIVGEGNRNFPEFVIPTDPKYRGRALAMWEAAGTKLMAGGGIIGDVGDFLGGAAKKVGGAVMSGVDFLSDPGKMWDKATAFIRDKIAAIGSNPMAKAVGRIPSKMLTGLKDKIVKAATDFFGGGGGKWARPVSAALGTRYGVKGSMWSSGYHTGTDFPAPTGTAVRAAANGIVQSALSGGPYGRHITIRHGELSSMYAHLSSMGVRAGQRVPKGTRIGAVGATGNTTGPHLHFEARRGGRTINPEPLLGYARGGRPRPGSWGVVGERGPEIMRFGGPSQVFDNQTSREMVGAAKVGAMVRNQRQPGGPAVRAAALRGRSGRQLPAEPGNTYNVYARTVDMTVRDLELLQRRQDALARVGRPR
ncbi:phage tail tape measure protein [Streptomyces sp. NBC_01725]|uniref:peptidoglycan DD-metalloendopeptidase family protein n=1 Tax=Streptomyces sp. NBC_01725 TaxID=2975923 RepID=UPI002E2971AC|nr:phage tail tape measure protein [Streptomyces sp. NBC_01725]